jgi:hypothetical protein
LPGSAYSIVGLWSVAQSLLCSRFSFPRTDSAYGLCDRDARRDVTVHDGDADLDCRDLPIEVPYLQALAKKFNAMNLRFDAALDVVSTPVSSDHPAEVFQIS